MLHYLSTAGGSVGMQFVALYAVTTDPHNEYLEVLYNLRWPILVIFALILTDFWSGLAASVRIRHEDFRLSRALRRTLVKACEYVALIIFAAILTKGIFEPLFGTQPATGGAVGAAFALICEGDSILSHLCDLHGIKSRFSVKRFIVAYLKRKNQDAGEALEDAIDGDEKTTHTPS